MWNKCNKDSRWLRGTTTMYSRFRWHPMVWDGHLTTNIAKPSQLQTLHHVPTRNLKLQHDFCRQIKKILTNLKVCEDLLPRGHLGDGANFPSKTPLSLLKRHKIGEFHAGTTRERHQNSVCFSFSFFLSATQESQDHLNLCVDVTWRMYVSKWFAWRQI